MLIGLFVCVVVACVRGDVYESMYSVQPALLKDPTLIQAACYQNYHTVPPGYDYQLCSDPVSSSIFIAFAIHGGKIEPQTSELTRDMAIDPLDSNGTWGTYYFEGLRPSNNSALHVTATHFDDPTLLGMIYDSSLTNTSTKWCVSNHGYSYDDVSICVGGDSQSLRDNTIAALELAYPDIIVYDGSTAPECKSLSGISSDNIVNRCFQGLQLEMSTGLRERFAESATYRKSFAQLIRSVVILTAMQDNKL